MGAGSSSSFNPLAYQGRWYEIAKYPFPFQRDCDSATADYIYRQPNLEVINTCYSNGQPIRQNVGYASPTQSPGVLSLKFDYELVFGTENKGYTIPSFPAPYIVLWTDYNNWSFVGSADKLFFWVLSRKPTITTEDQAFIIRKVEELGYDVSKLTA